MTGSYLFNYESYYNGLMTDLGLYPNSLRNGKYALSEHQLFFPSL